jgi:hypothetical protein
VPAQNLTSASIHGSATISQLLEDVNDIVQLESDDWGLEDYVVEVGGYECLHFQPIDSVLKEDDKVTIRALQTSDLRLRRIGGRHQITADGRHLFDGIAFGRPYLRKASRPPFPIPPRKRRKLDIGHGQYIEDETNQELIQGSESVVYNGADVVRDEWESSNSHDRLWEVLAGQPLHEIGHDSAGEGDDDESDSDFRSFDEEEGDEIDMELSEELKALLEDDPSEPGDEEADENILVTDAQQDTDGLSSMRQHKKRKRDPEDESEHASVDLNGDSNSSTLAVVAVPPKQHNHIAPSINGSSSQAGEDVDLAEQWRASQDDFNGFDENAPSNEIGSPIVTSSEPDSESSSSGSSLVSKSVSSSTGSESESGSESSSASESGLESDLESDSNSDSTSENDSEAIAVSTAKHENKKGQATKTQPTLSAISNSVQNAPGQGSISTKKNNRRQWKRKRLRTLKAAGLLAPDAGFKELSAFELAKSEAPVTNQMVPVNSLESTFEARKERLLERLTPPKADSNAGLDPSEEALEYVSEAASHGLAYGSNAASAQPQAAINDECQNAKPNKRAKLDLDSSRRMLFGSLGLKTPKTPADEQLLREKLAKQGRTPMNGRSKHTTTGKDDVSDTPFKEVAEIARSEGWKDKILLSAAECEVEGQFLTEPPFPFVQRWQHGDQKDQPRCQTDWEDAACSPEGQQDIISTSVNEPEISAPSLDGDPVLDGAKLNGSIQSQLILEAEELSKRQGINSPNVLDVPLITEVNTLEALKVEDAVAGAVIAFRHLDMSKATNWQPELSPYRTATIQEVLNDGTLKILLAERDRTPMQAIFDEFTGERVFDRFEMPIDEEDMHPDNGIRDMSYSDLIEPKLVDGKPLSTSFGQSTQTACSSTMESKLDEEISQVKDSAQLTDPSVQQPSAQVEVSTPRQREISRLIKDAGFHSSLDSDLLQPPGESAGSGSHDDDSSRASPLKAEKSYQASSSRSMKLNGAFSEADDNDLKSPLFRGSDSSSMQQDDEFHDSSGNFEQNSQTSGIQNSQLAGSWRLQNSVVYPRISPLVIHDGREPTMDGNMRPQKAHSNSGSKDAKSDDGSDMSDKENESMFEGGDSLFDSLKSTIPPSYVAPLKDRPPSPAGSQITNPCLSELEGKTSSDDDLPSLSEITSTARSGRISPPKLKTSTSPPIASSLGERTSSAPERYTTQTQDSTRFQSSQIPPGSQFVDLTLSSDPISPANSDGDYGATQRSSARIKQSSSQIKARDRVSSRGMAGNRRLVRGRFGRPTT